MLKTTLVYVSLKPLNEITYISPRKFKPSLQGKFSIKSSITNQVNATSGQNFNSLLNFQPLLIGIEQVYLDIHKGYFGKETSMGIK